MSALVTATFLFTDLVDSTALAARLGRDAADAMRTTHFTLLRGAMATAGGVEVKNLGDGLMVVFTSTTRALAGAVAMQQAIDRHNQHATTPLSIRIGVSHGDATEEDGDYFGDAVVEAARLCAAAAGGQILASELTALVVGRHAEQVMEPVGDLELKGLPEPVSAVAVRWEPLTTPTDGRGAPLPPQLVSVGGQAVFAFFGRTEELRIVDDLRKSVLTDGRLRTVMIGGEPGMGKTSLAARVARNAHAEGAHVAFGGCLEDLCPPYGPWVDALAHLVIHAAPGALDALRPVHVGTLRRLLPNVSDRLPIGDPVADPERFLLMEAVVALLEALSADQPAVVVLDDVQWADEASVALLRHLVGSVVPMHALVLATYRTSEVTRGDALGGLLADAHRAVNLHRIHLQGLSDVDVVELIAAAAGHDLDDEGVALAHAVHRETDGNAFFVTEVLRHLSESGEITAGADGRYALARDLDAIALPQSVRETVERRVARLGEDTARTLAAAAVIGAEFDVDVLRAVVDVDEDALLDVLDRAASAALVAEGPGVGEYRFAHALVQHTMAQSLSATRRQRLHQRIAEALEARGAPTGELARHWIAATRPSDTTRARRYAEQAGVEALAALAPVDAVRWYTQALELLDQDAAPDARERCRLFVGLARAHGACGASSDQRTATEQAGLLALELDDAELIVETALTLSAANSPFDPSDDREQRLIRAALDVVGPDDTATRARLLAALAEATDARDWRARHELVTEALAVAARLGDRATELEILVATDPISAPTEHLDQRLLATQRAVADRDRLSSPAARSAILVSRGHAVLEAGDIEGFAACVDLFEADDRLYGLPMTRANRAGHSGVLALIRGDTVAAEALALEQFQALSAVGHSAAQPMLGAALFQIRRTQGNLADIVDLFEAATDAAVAMPVFQIMLGRLYAEVGRLDDARVMFRQLTARDVDDIVPRDLIWLSAMLGFADLAADLGERDAATALRDLLGPFGRHFATTGMTFDGAVAAVLGRLDHVLGDRDAARRHFDDAVAMYRRLDAPYWTARTLLDRADLLDDDPDPAAAALAEDDRAEARAIASRHGFEGLARRAG